MLSTPLVLLLAGLLAFPCSTLGAGALDPTFDGDGKVVTDFGGDDTANDIVVQTDGKFVAAGTSGGDFALARYNVDGSLDSSFGGDGKVVTDLGGSVDGARGAALQADGKIVAAGSTDPPGPGQGRRFALARYNTDGSLDPSFSGDGRVVTNSTYGGAYDVAIQSDGKIVAAGGEADFVLARYNADGGLDSSFDGDGLVYTDYPYGFYDSARSVAIQPDGKIVAGGTTYTEGGDYLVLVRYNPDGGLDSTFGGGSGIALGSSKSANGLAIQPDGKLVTAGSGGEWYYDFVALDRFNPDGSYDGIIDTHFGGFDDIGEDLSIQADGKIVVAGRIRTSTSRDFGLVRYTPDLHRDPNFDFDSRVETDFGGNDGAHAVAIGTGGRIVAAGFTGTGNNDSDFALARYSSTGTTLPKISVNDVTRFEGNGGVTAFGFKVTLSSESAQTVTVSAQTASGSASAPADYTAVGPTTVEFTPLTLRAPGETTKTVIVKVKSDLAMELNEGFFLKLSNPSGATIADGEGKGTIQNDDLSSEASCTITGTSAGETLNGTPGNDVICAGGGNDRLYGLDGNDVLKGEGGDDLLVGGNGYDLLLGASGADQGQGGAGNDTLWGGDQADTLAGGINSDALFGEVGADSLNTKDSVSANDKANGGADSDSCTVDARDVVVSCP